MKRSIKPLRAECYTAGSCQIFPGRSWMEAVIYTISASASHPIIDEILLCTADQEPNRGLLWQPMSLEHPNDLDLDEDPIWHAE